MSRGEVRARASHDTEKRAGVERVLDILRTELRVPMQQIGAPSLNDLTPSMIVNA